MFTRHDHGRGARPVAALRERGELARELRLRARERLRSLATQSLARADIERLLAEGTHLTAGQACAIGLHG